MLSNFVAGSLTTYDSFFLPLLPLRNLSKTKKYKRVLIIDDDQAMASQIQLLLQFDRDLKVSVAQDPFEAMDLMTEHAYDLIVLEWDLPKLNGHETLVAAEKGFKFEPNLPLEWENKKVPVIILSSCEKSKCKPPYTKHFKYLAHVKKTKPISEIVDLLRFHFQRAV